MKLNEIKLFESQNLSEYKKNIQIMLDKKNYLYRGSSSSTNQTPANLSGLKAFYNKPRTKEREAKGSVLAAAISKNWTELPNRALSTFVSGDEDHASRFGKLFLVIPKSENFGVIDRDFNSIQKVDNLTYLENDITDFINNIELLFKRLDIDNYHNPHLTNIMDDINNLELNNDSIILFTLNDIKILNYIFNNIKSVFKDMTANSFEIPPSIQYELFRINQSINDLGASDFNELMTKFSYKDFGIKHAKSLSEIPPYIGEVWFEGEYLSVELDGYTAEEILKQLEAL